MKLIETLRIFLGGAIGYVSWFISSVITTDDTQRIILTLFMAIIGIVIMIFVVQED